MNDKLKRLRGYTCVQSYVKTRDVNMDHSGSKRQKINKNHDKQKIFQLGISVGRNDLNLESHFQMQYHGKTIKNLHPLKIIRR